MLSSRTSFSIIVWKTKSSCGTRVEVLPCISDSVKNHFPVSCIALLWATPVKQDEVYMSKKWPATEWLHVETKGRKKKKKRRTCVYQDGGLLLLPVPQAATSTLTVMSRGAVIPAQLRWAMVPAPRPGDRLSLRRVCLSSSEELYFFRLCIQEKETSPWAFRIGSIAV